jgi:hypothetical protein
MPGYEWNFKTELQREKCFLLQGENDTNSQEEMEHEMWR